jgi:hypothetical protein
MYVELCYKTKDTPEGKIHRSKRMTVKEAMVRYVEIEPVATKAYLRHFDGWNWLIYRVLKEEGC